MVGGWPKERVQISGIGSSTVKLSMRPSGDHDPGLTGRPGVSKVETDADQLEQALTVEPAADLDHLSVVQVLLWEPPR